MTTLAAILFAATVADWPEPTDAVYLSGQSTYMSRGTMAQVAFNRGHLDAPDLLQYDAWLRANGYAGAVALNRKGDLGRVVWLAGPIGVEGPFYVMDCAQEGHYQAREEASRVVEVDYWTAERWGMAGVGPVDVTVLFAEPDVERMR